MENTLKILTFGNSYGQDSQKYLHAILDSVGIDSICFDLVISGCSLERHHTTVKENIRDYRLEINAIPGKQLVTIEDVIGLYDWDVITFHQASRFSGFMDSYEPYLGELLAYVKEKSPSSKVYLQETWAYGNECHKDDWFERYDRDQQKMYRMIRESYGFYAKKYGLPLIRTGEVIESLRGKAYFNEENGGISLHRDGFHMNIPYGRYIVGLVWAKTLAGIDPTEVAYDPDDSDPEICEYIRNAVSEFYQNQEK